MDWKNLDMANASEWLRENTLIAQKKIEKDKKKNKISFEVPWFYTCKGCGTTGVPNPWSMVYACSTCNSMVSFGG